MSGRWSSPITRVEFEDAGRLPLGLNARQGSTAMASTDTQELTLLAKLVIAAGVALMVAGAVSHPLTIATVERIWYQELARASAPMKFRFVLQLLMAALLAFRDGRKDAQAGSSPYIWAVLREPRERRARLIHGLNQTARIIVLGLVMDVIYQLIFLKVFYPVEALIIALVLAFVPYLIIRGLAARVTRRWGRRISPIKHP